MIKSYSDLEQSKKLAEILPLESADMCYPYNRHLSNMYGDIPYVIGYKKFNEDTDFPCWSLAALLGVLPKQIHNNGLWWLQIDYIHNSVSYMGKDNSVLHYVLMDSDKSLVDACVAMVKRLNELNLL